MSQEELEEYKQQLAVIDDGLADDPGNADLLELKTELENLVKLLTESLGGSKDETVASKQPGLSSSPQRRSSTEPEDHGSEPALSTPLTSTPASPTVAKIENHSPSRSPSQPPSDNGLGGIKVGDEVMAKWVSGDRNFYMAKVTSITGSEANRSYTVRLATKPTHTIETVRADAIRLKQRPSGKPATYKVTKNTPSQPQQSKAKILDDSKAKWQQFNKKPVKGLRKKQGEQSMFRSPDDVDGRVGVISSGRSTHKDKPRTKRHTFDSNVLG